MRLNDTLKSRQIRSNDNDIKFKDFWKALKCLEYLMKYQFVAKFTKIKQYKEG